MSDESKKPLDTAKPLKEGYQPVKKGYQPGTSNLNPAKPPQGGSGVPPKESGKKGAGKN